MNNIVPIEDFEFQNLELDFQQEFIDFRCKYPIGCEAFVFDDAGRITGPVIILGEPQLYAGEDFEETGDLIWIVAVGQKGDTPEFYYYITSVFVWEEEESSPIIEC